MKETKSINKCNEKLKIKTSDVGSRFNNDGSRFNNDGNRFNNDGSRFNDDSSRFDDDVSRFNDDGSRFNDDGSMFNDGGSRQLSFCPNSSVMVVVLTEIFQVIISLGID